MLVASAALCGCFPGEQRSNARLIPYHHVGTQRVVDPKTGDLVVTSTWQYEDGYTATTTRRIPRGNEDRRNDAPRPEARVTD